MIFAGWIRGRKEKNYDINMCIYCLWNRTCIVIVISFSKVIDRKDKDTFKRKAGIVMNRGFFGNMFDMNRDGKLDAWERTLDIMAFNDLMEEEEQEEEETEPWIDDDEDQEEDWDDDDGDEEW